MVLFKESRFGGAKRLYYFAKELETIASVYAICLDVCGEATPAASSNNKPQNSFFLSMAPRNNLWNKLFQTPVDLSRQIGVMAPEIRKFLPEVTFDVVLCAYPLTLGFIGKNALFTAKKVIYLEDDLLLEVYRRDVYKYGKNLPNPLKYFRYYQLLSYYQSKLPYIHSVINISPQERDVTKGYFPGVCTNVVKYGVPMEEYSFLLPPKDRTVLGFIGNFHHEPNLKALFWLVNALFPAITEAIEGVRLVIAGKGIPEEAINGQSGMPQVSFIENIERLNDFYSSIGIFINPVISGRGLRTKVVEAAAFGRPIISTKLGCEGLEELMVQIAETEEGFIEGIRHLRCPENYNQARNHNREVIETCYSTTAIGKQLFDIIVSN